MVLATAPTSAVAGDHRRYDAATRTATFTPTAALATSTAYTATVSGAKDAAGNTMAPVTWSFTTAARHRRRRTTGRADRSPWSPATATRSPLPRGDPARRGPERVRQPWDLPTLTATTLAPYDVVVLGDVR